ncbi:MAG: nuclear transport factor 2 family protein, partial [Luteimonas sp.]
DVYREEAVGENASLVMRGVTSRLSGAMAAGNAAMAASLFTSDAVFEDMTLRAEIQGREAIQRYLARAISQLPYGMASRHRHTVGSDKGGGYEWWGAPSSPGKTGVTALVLDSSGFISRATSVYDGALFSAAQLQTLAVLSLEP